MMSYFSLTPTLSLWERGIANQLPLPAGERMKVRGIFWNHVYALINKQIYH